MIEKPVRSSGAVAVGRDERAQRIADLRARMDAIVAPTAAVQFEASSGSVGSSGSVSSSLPFAERGVVGIGADLGELFPGCGLARSAVTLAADVPALIVELIAQVTAGGGHVAVVGWPDLAYAQLTAHGALDRVIAVPDPGSDVLAILGVLAEGMDLVVSYWSTPMEITPSRARPLMAKLRHGHAALLMVGARIASPAASIEATVAGFTGIGCGTGRIRGVELDVRVSAKGHYRPASKRVVIGAASAGGSQNASPRSADGAQVRHLKAV